MTLELRFTLPGQRERTVSLNRSRMLLGTLLSNQVVLKADQVEPIHALIEQNPDGSWQIIDLGSTHGVFVNGSKIDVESSFTEKDSFVVGTVHIAVQQHVQQTMVDPRSSVALDQSPGSRPTTPSYEEPSSEVKATLKRPETPSSSEPATKRRRKTLFSPRDARPSGDVLEVVAFWDHTVLEVEHFHPDVKGFQSAVIGDPSKEGQHFITGSKGNNPSVLAKAGHSGYTLKMSSSMKARVRKSGKVEKFSGKNSLTLGRRDIAHVKYHSINYFLMFVNPPKLVLPPAKNKDPLFFMLSAAMTLLFMVAVVPIMVMSWDYKKKDKLDDDRWATINIAQTIKKPKKVVMPPKPKIKQVKKPPVMPPPPKIKPMPVKPVKPKIVKKPKPMPMPKPKTNKQNRLKAPMPSPSKKVSKNPSPKPMPKSAGLASAGFKKPDFKSPGPMIPGLKSGRSGGAKGAGNNKRGAKRKGNKTFDNMGVKGGKSKKPSGVNLAKLGFGVKTLNKNGPGAISTPFKSSGGGLGAGGGSGKKNLGFGGSGGTRSLGIPGSRNGANNFGGGNGGYLSGKGGKGGLGTGVAGRGNGGRGVQIDVPAADAPAGGGLTSEEIMAVIRANINQIRHCYEQFLQRNPGRSGTVRVGFQVATSGRVNRAKILSSSISDSKLKGCITGKIKRWKFPKPRSSKPVDVTYPFNFAPG